MSRKITALVLLALAAGLVSAPAQAKKPVPPTTYYISWAGDCAGAGYLATKASPNPDACALFFPELGSSYSFGALDGLPFALDAGKPLAVDFSLSHVASVAAKFDVTVSGQVNGKDTEIAAGSTTVVAAGPGSTPVHLDLEPDAALHRGKVTMLSLTVTWSEGVTYSQMQLEGGDATLVLSRLK
ncbi:MAG TPA: hypothetical protein VG318_12470 [Actinomycetota bacterium]|nr:hypothetical protein [Actinomycetota bacterium]